MTAKRQPPRRGAPAQKRERKGTPGGGRFAATRLPEQDWIDLGDGPLVARRATPAPRPTPSPPAIPAPPSRLALAKKVVTAPVRFVRANVAMWSATGDALTGGAGRKR